MEEEEGRGVWGGRERDGGECVVVRVSLVSDVVDVLFVCPQIESNFFKLAGLISQVSFPSFSLSPPASTVGWLRHCTCEWERDFPLEPRSPVRFSS